MEAIAVPLLVLRGALTDTLLREGATLGGRVLERNGAHGLLLLAGTPLVAVLPGSVVAGQRLRLRVAEAGPERVLLQVLPDAGQPASSPAATGSSPGVLPTAAYAAALPGGATARLLTDADADGGDGLAPDGPRAVTLRYDSPRLGRLDLRLEAGACAVHVTPGAPAAEVAAAAPGLRDALTAATGRPVRVTIHLRRSALDVRT